MEVDMPTIVTGIVSIVILVVIMIVLGLNIFLGYKKSDLKYKERAKERKSFHNDDK